jgi:hypothetical protein
VRVPDLSVARPVRPLVGAEEGPGEEKGVTVEDKGPELRRERRRCQAREGRKRRGWRRSRGCGCDVRR